MKKRTLFGTALILSSVLGGGTIAATQTAGETVDGAASQGTATSDAATTQTNSQVKDAGTATVSSRQGAQVPATSTKTSTTSGNRLPATGNVREGGLTLLGILALLGGSVLGIKAFRKRN